MYRERSRRRMTSPSDDRRDSRRRGVAPRGRADKRSVRPAAVRRQRRTVRRRQRDRLPGDQLGTNRRPRSRQGLFCLDAGIAAGGNAARLGNVAFAIDDDSQLLADARTRAFEDAKNRAEQYADLSGTSLENVVTITEAHDTSGGQTMRAPDASMSDMVLAPGTQQVSFEVTVTWLSADC